MKLSLRLFVITAVAVAPLTAVLIYNLVTLRREQEREIHAEAARISELVSLEMSQIILGTGNLLRAVVSAPVVRRSDAAGCEDFLSSIVKQLPQYVGIVIIDQAGIIRCSPERPKAEVFVGDREYFGEARRTGKLTIGTFTEGRLTNRPSLPIAIPLTGGGPWSGGVAVAGLDLDWLGALVKDRTFKTGSALTIADRNGRILAREPLPEEFVGTVIPDDFLHLVTADAPGTLELTSQDGTRRVIGYTPANATPVGLYVSVGLSTAAAFATLNAATVRGLAIAFASIVLAFLLAKWTSDAFIAQPFGQLVGTIGKWRRADLTARTGMTASAGELGAVGKAIDDFMDELESARASRRKAEQQREMLLGELDHRVKNLLASVQAVARQSFRGERTDAIDVFLQRLTTMGAAHGLLMRDEWQEAGTRDLVEAAVAPFNDPNRSQFSLSGPPFTLNSNAALAFGMALHELCTNAVKYGALQTSDGHVDITWDVAPASGGDGAAFRLIWRERGGPPVVPPAGKGFGSRMIEQALAHQIGGEATIDYRPDGVVCVAAAPAASVGSNRESAS